MELSIVIRQITTSDASRGSILSADIITRALPKRRSLRESAGDGGEGREVGA